MKKILADIEAAPLVPNVLESVLSDPILMPGTWIEFGVYQGESLRKMAHASRCVGRTTVWGVDSFLGLPEEWHNEGPLNAPCGQKFPKGSYSVSEVPSIEGAQLLVGLFEDVLPRFSPPDITLLHIDCDLYASASCVFRWYSARRAEGAIVVFDEIYNYVGFEEGEMKALYESNLGEYRWLCRSKDQQAALVLL